MVIALQAFAIDINKERAAHTNLYMNNQQRWFIMLEYAEMIIINITL